MDAPVSAQISAQWRKRPEAVDALRSTSAMRTKLAEAMGLLSMRADLHEKLAAQISNRLIKSWAEYAAEICSVLESAF